VILEGTVSVLVPQKKKAAEDNPPPQLTPKGAKKGKGEVEKEGPVNRPPTPVSMYEVAVLGKGKHFGELALTTNKPRAATVRCQTTTHLMVLSKHDYMKVLSRFEEANLREFVDFLK
jgi:CRP-like cAMP-binding protein